MTRLILRNRKKELLPIWHYDASHGSDDDALATRTTRDAVVFEVVKLGARKVVVMEVRGLTMTAHRSRIKHHHSIKATSDPSSLIELQ